MVNMKKLIKYVMVLFIVCLFCAFHIAQAADVTLEWNPVPEATGYNAYYGIESGVYGEAIDAGNNTTYTIIDLPPHTYYFVVTAYNTYGESGYSDEISGEVKPLSELPPPNPDGLTGKVIYTYVNGILLTVEFVPDPPANVTGN